MGVALVTMGMAGLAVAIVSRGEHTTLTISIIMSLLAGAGTFTTLPKLKDAFIKANLSGRDLLKPTKPLL